MDKEITLSEYLEYCKNKKADCNNCTFTNCPLDESFAKHYLQFTIDDIPDITAIIRKEQDE